MDNKKVLEFAEKQNKELIEMFIKSDINYDEFKEALPYIALNSVVAVDLFNLDTHKPTEEQILEAKLRVCDDFIKWFVGYKTRLIDTLGNNELKEA